MYPELTQLIGEFRDRMLIPFSPAHIYDKESSLSERPDLFWPEMDYLSEFTQNKLLRWDDKKKRMSAEIATARQVAISLVESRELIKEFSDFNKIVSYMRESYDDLDISDEEGLIDRLEMMLNMKFEIEEGKQESVKDHLQKSFEKSQEIQNNPEMYRELRKQMHKQFRLESNASNWDGDVISKINAVIKEETEHEDFISFVADMLKEEERQDRSLFYTQCYVHLGNIGFWPDEIKKNKGMKNHMYDALHSFYGGHCDYFVVKDKRMEKKTKALFQAFGVYTKVVRYDELELELRTVFSDSTSLADIGRLIEEEGDALRVEGDLVVGNYELDTSFLDYFTHVKVEIGHPQKITGITYTRAGYNYSNFLYYHEFDSILKRIGVYLGEADLDNLLENFKTGVKEKGEHFEDFGFADHAFIRLYANHEEFVFCMMLYSSEMCA